MTRPAPLSRRLCCGGSLFLIAVLHGACSQSPNELGGDTDLTMTQVGQVIRLSNPTVGGTSLSLDATATVVKNEDGIVTLRVQVDLSREPSLAIYAGLLPDSALDSDGNIDTEFKLKITSEGMQDFFDGDPHTYIKYDADVGDNYPLTTAEGLTITREVVARSDQDDFPYKTMQIKTVTVEQNSRIPGIQKITYRANHKFGIVWLEMTPESGPSASTYIFFPN